MISLKPKWSQVVESESPDAVLKGLELVWGCTSVRFPEYAPLDYVLSKSGFVRAVIEMRTEVRFHSERTHEIPRERLEPALHIADKLKVPLFLVVRFYDGLYYVDIGSLNYPSHDGHYRIPTAHFHEVRP